MKDMTKWEQKGRNTVMSSSGPKKRAGKRMAGNDGGKRTAGGDAKAGSGGSSKAGGGSSKAGGGSSKAGGGSSKAGGGDSNLMKAGLAVAAGLIVAALAKGVKDSDYYD